MSLGETSNTMNLSNFVLNQLPNNEAIDAFLNKNLDLNLNNNYSSYASDLTIFAETSGYDYPNLLRVDVSANSQQESTLPIFYSSFRNYSADLPLKKLKYKSNNIKLNFILQFDHSPRSIDGTTSDLGDGYFEFEFDNPIYLGTLETFELYAAPQGVGVDDLDFEYDSIDFSIMDDSITINTIYNYYLEHQEVDKILISNISDENNLDGFVLSDYYYKFCNAPRNSHFDYILFNNETEPVRFDEIALNVTSESVDVNLLSFNLFDFDGSVLNANSSLNIDIN